MFDDLTVRDRFGALFELVVMAASAGGMRAFTEVVAGLPGDFPAPVVLVQHICPDRQSHLAAILRRRAAVRVKQAEDGERLRPGTVYTPVPGRHLAVTSGGAVTLSASSKVQFARPSADVLFESAAAGFGGRVIAAVLTGGGSDGAAGVVAVRRQGGFVIAQNEATAENPWMPHHAILTRQVDLVLPLGRIAFALRTLVAAGTPGG